jgi:hypothetical protein
MWVRLHICDVVPFDRLTVGIESPRITPSSVEEEYARVVSTNGNQTAGIRTQPTEATKARILILILTQKRGQGFLVPVIQHHNSAQNRVKECYSGPFFYISELSFRK